MLSVVSLFFFQSDAYLFYDICQFLHRLCPKHGDACLSEIGYSLEYRRCRQMTTCVQDAPIFVDSIDIYLQLFKENVDFVVE